MFPAHTVVKPIRVYENETNFVVEIPANQKIRASRIAGRRWDPRFVAWIYPKTIDCYESLKAEFQKDAELFDIRKPKRQPILEARVNVSDDDSNSEFEREWKELSENTSNIHTNFSEVSGKLDFLVSTVKSLEDASISLERMILARNLEAALNSDYDSAVDKSGSLDLSEQLELGLKHIAFESSGRDMSFKQHLEKYNPILKPERFVARTHEHLMHALAAISGDPNPSESAFSRYVNHVKDNGLVRNDREKKVPAILFMLNGHRNQIIHSKDMPEAELQNRAISYLMGVAQIWSEIASEPVEGDE